MKYKNGYYIAALWIVLLVGFKCKENGYVVSEENYDSQCIIGNKYALCPPKNSNPFDVRGIAHVTIVAKREGYVQYCYTSEIGSKYVTYFSRTCKEFIQLIDNCK